jgi:soluble lytic murein transglycosylase-like protein
MTQTSSSYVRRTDRERKRRRVRRALLAVGLTLTGALTFRHPEPQIATAAPTKPVPALVRGRRLPAPAPTTEHGYVARSSVVRATPAEALGLSAVAESVSSARRLSRWHRVYRYAGHYGIAPDLAVAIHDIALAEGIEPDLAFRLVRAESEFNERATSPVGAVGLTQVMPGTAKYFVRGVSKKRLYERHLNLHVGFRYLRGLIKEYGSLRLALLAYNRGPGPVNAALARGDDPANGYEQVVAKGYAGRGVVTNVAH